MPAIDRSINGASYLHLPAELAHVVRLVLDKLLDDVTRVDIQSDHLREIDPNQSPKQCKSIENRTVATILRSTFFSSERVNTCKIHHFEHKIPRF